MSNSIPAQRAAVQRAEHAIILGELNRLKGYSGSIQGTSLDTALDEQRFRCWEVASIIETVAISLKALYGEADDGWRALGVAARMVKEVADDLESGMLEDRALEIARKPELITPQAAALAAVVPD